AGSQAATALGKAANVGVDVVGQSMLSLTQAYYAKKAPLTDQEIHDILLENLVQFAAMSVVGRVSEKFLSDVPVKDKQLAERIKAINASRLATLNKAQRLGKLRDLEQARRLLQEDIATIEREQKVVEELIAQAKKNGTDPGQLIELQGLLQDQRRA